MVDKRSQVHVGDVGNVIYLTVRNRETKAAIDISQATLMEINFWLPGETSAIKKTGSFYTDGSDGVVQYAIEADITPTAGVIDYELELTLPNRFWTSDPIQLYVKENLS
jgi:hypothetical protein